MALSVSVCGDGGEHDIVEYLPIEGRSGPNTDSDTLVISPSAEIRPICQPVNGHQKVEVWEPGRGSIVCFLPVSEPSVSKGK